MRALLCLLLLCASNAQAEQPLTLTVTVKGIDTEQQGQLLAYLYQGKDNWLEKDRATKQRIIPVAAEQLELTFTALSAGKDYALQVIHDANSNGKLDMRWLPPGPKEGVSVTHNQFRMGPPAYKTNHLVLNSDTHYTMSMQY